MRSTERCAGRITQANTANTSWTFTYDANGNRTGGALNGGQPAPCTIAAASNRLLALSNPAISLTSDAAGNATSDVTYSLAYDLRGHLASVTAGVVTSYTYDNEGRRVRKSSSVGAGATIFYAYDTQDHLLGEYDVNGTPLREYVWLGDIPVAVFTPDPSNAMSAPLVYFIHADHINTPRVVMDRDNVMRWSWFVEPFGTTLADNNPSGIGSFVMSLRFPGQVFDVESGMYCNMNRDYVPGVGRYAQSDPIGLAGEINTYSYVDASPLSKVDPTGLFSWSDVSDAWSHYCDGSGTDWSTSFSSLNWGDTETSISEKIKNLVGGSCKDVTIPVEFTSEGQTGGADAWIVGRHSVKTKGAIQLSCDCTWKFSGDLSSARGYDPYDFDKSNRGFIAETAIAVGRASCKNKAKSFKILITGSKAMSLSGKVKG